MEFLHSYIFYGKKKLKILWQFKKKIKSDFRRYIQGRQFTKDVRIDGKVVIITGCNTGLGKETALDLARRGGRIYMACRDFNRCEEARLDIVRESGNKNVFNRLLDLSSLESVRTFAQE